MSVCVSKTVLAAMGLGPVLPAYGFLCNPHLGNGQAAGIGGCQPGVPCCAGIPLSVFNPLPYPIAAGAAQIAFSNPDFLGPANTYNIRNDADLLAYLNNEVLPTLIPPSYTVEGIGSQWSIVGGIVYAPKVNGTCEQVMIPILGQAPPQPMVLQPTSAPIETVRSEPVAETTDNHSATASVETQPTRNRK